MLGDGLDLVFFQGERAREGDGNVLMSMQGEDIVPIQELSLCCKREGHFPTRGVLTDVFITHSPCQVRTRARKLDTLPTICVVEPDPRGVVPGVTGRVMPRDIHHRGLRLGGAEDDLKLGGII